MENFSLKIHDHQIRSNEQNDNVDVDIFLKDGRVFTATFFTLKNIQSLFDQNKMSGECARGLYFWASDIILVESLSEDVIRRSIADLLSTGELEAACSLVRTGSS